MVIKVVNKLIRKFGYTVRKNLQELPEDISRDLMFVSLYNRCKDFTMTSVERMYSLYISLNYIIENKIEGDFAECGVWKGGSSMLMALFLKEKGVTDRRIILYDTFEGMSEPSNLDKTIKGDLASALLDVQSKEDDASIWCFSPLDEVKQNLYSTGYPKDKLIFVKGKVEDTLRNSSPDKLSLLRLDTDWYESTRIELQILYPLLETKGILIIDDFGHWEGAKKAVIEYFNELGNGHFLHRIDFTGRLLVK